VLLVVGSGMKIWPKTRFEKKGSFWPIIEVRTSDQPLGTRPPNWNANTLVPRHTGLGNYKLNQ
jgi:hypothetical protein